MTPDPPFICPFLFKQVLRVFLCLNCTTIAFSFLHDYGNVKMAIGCLRISRDSPTRLDETTAEMFKNLYNGRVTTNDWRRIAWI